jgi:hypothetical protein
MSNEYFQNQLNQISNELLSISKEINNINVKKNNTSNIKRVLYLKKSNLANIILTLRNLFATLPYSDSVLNEYPTIDDFDNSLSDDFKVSLSIIDYKDFFAYKIKLPIILPRVKSNMNRVLIINSFDNAYKKLSQASDVEIQKIDNPVIVFENHFIKDSEQNGVKDLDNYELSDVLNIIQTYLIHDDRTASIYQKNIFDGFANYTIIYVLEEKNFIPFLISH